MEIRGELRLEAERNAFPRPLICLLEASNFTNMRPPRMRDQRAFLSPQGVRGNQFMRVKRRKPKYPRSIMGRYPRTHPPTRRHGVRSFVRSGVNRTRVAVARVTLIATWSVAAACVWFVRHAANVPASRSCSRSTVASSTTRSRKPARPSVNCRNAVAVLVRTRPTMRYSSFTRPGVNLS